MAHQRKPRAVKIQEFYAHMSNVNSVHIGRKSMGVFATGGDDQKINVWRLGKTQPIMSLTGHNTEVDSVLFDGNEALIAAGSRGGTIKVWDLSQEKLLRSLSGHRASVSCLDFHPYGDYFASGSTDTNIKIFDVRKKNCMQTYRGHQTAVTAIKHSPDGRWIVSGDAEGVIKVWDLTTGKEINEFRLLRKEPVTSLDFHPNEFLLAVAGEHQLNFWDMENFGLICSTPQSASSNRVISFSRCGRSLLAGASDALRSWTWEPCEAVGTVGVEWSSGGAALADMVEVSGVHEIVAVAKHRSLIAVHVVDVANLPPFDRPLSPSSDDDEAPPQTFESILDRFQNVSLSSAAGSADAPLPPVASPPPAQSPSASPFSHQKSPAPKSHILSTANPNFFQAHGLTRDGPTSPIVAVPSRPPPSFAQPLPPVPQQTSSGPAMSTTGHHVSIGTDMTQQFSQPLIFPTAAAAAAAAPINNFNAPPSRFQVSPTQPSVVSSSTTSSAVPSTSASASASAAASPPPATASSSSSSATSLRSRIDTEHAVMMSIIKSRLALCAQLEALWTQASPVTSPSSANQIQPYSSAALRACVELLVKTQDQSVCVDFLTHAENIIDSKHLFTLDIATLILPLLQKLLVSKFENYASISMKYIKNLLFYFTPLIQSTRSAAPSNGVDLMREERLQKSNDCFEAFRAIYPSIQPIAKRTNALGEMARETRKLLEGLLFEAGK